MKNYGKVDCKVEIGDVLPFFKKENQIKHFEVTARQWKSVISTSKYFKPMLAEHLSSEKGSMEVIYPEKRKQYVDNYLEDGGYDPTAGPSSASESGRDSQFIMWRPIKLSEYASEDNLGIIKDVIPKFSFFDVWLPNSDDCKYYSGSPGEECDQDNAAVWVNTDYEAEGYPDDKSKIKENESFFKGITGIARAVEYVPAAWKNVLPKLGYIFQSNAKPGLLYCAESEKFLNPNMPFWVTIKRTIASPSNWNYETFIVISLGVGDGAYDGGGAQSASESDSVAQEYDIVLRNNARPELIDYWTGRDGTGKAALESEIINDPSYETPVDEGGGIEVPEYNRTIFDVDLANVLRTEQTLEIAIMTIAGRLVIFVNEVPLVYTRKNPYTGKLIEAQIASAPIRVYGSNCKMAINASPMAFAALAGFDTVIPSLTEEDGGWKHLNSKAEFEKKALVHLPSDPKTEPVNTPLYGCDCKNYKDEVGEANPKGFGFHKQGDIAYGKGGVAPEGSGLPGMDHYVVAMKPEDTTSFKGWKIINGGCPYFFRLRGSAKNIQESGGGFVDISEDVISITQNDSLDNDFTMLVKKLDVTLYNKGGKYDTLQNQQRVIRVSWGWCDTPRRTTFTGVTISSSIVESPGKEVINVHCEDPMWILKQMPIINSPYFDGMFSYAAIEVLLKMAGITAYDIDWPKRDEYFLPAGSGIDDPRVKFDPQTPIYNCILDIAQRDQSHMWFDGTGKANLRRIEGGIFFDTGGLVPVANFTRDPDSKINPVILNEKSVEYNLASTVNEMRILTLDRGTRDPIFYLLRPDAGFNPAPPAKTLLFRKTYYRWEAAFGDEKTCKLHTHRLAERMFFPILKTSFTVVGLDGDFDLSPLSFITVDGDSFRVTSAQRTYSADSNEYKMDISAEWLFGARGR